MRAPGPGSTGGSRPLPVETPPVHFVWVDAAIACMLAFNISSPPPSDPSKSQPLPENAGGGISRPSSRESSPRAAAATPTSMRGGQSARAREAAACGRWRRRALPPRLVVPIRVRRLLPPSHWAILAPNPAPAPRTPCERLQYARCASAQSRSALIKRRTSQLPAPCTVLCETP